LPRANSDIGFIDIFQNIYKKYIKIYAIIENGYKAEIASVQVVISEPREIIDRIDDLN
jgi:hypothetical protein